jgi:pectate lyase
MKKAFYLGFLFFSTFNIIGQNIYMTSPEGYGAAATGGGNATPVIVSTYTAFKNALQSTSPANAVILVSGTIDCVYTSVLLNNKTIIGLPGARLRNNQITVGNSTTSANNSGILNIKPGSNNVIIRNLIFEGPGAYDVDGRDNITNEGTNIWVDHCEFQDGMDGNFDNKGQADNVTISWCKFTYLKPAIPGGSGGSNDHRFSNLIGSSATDAPADGNYSITFQNCYWATGCKERMPRARNAQLHILNCYYNVQTSSSRALGLGGGTNNTTCYVENTHFANVNSVYTSYISTDGGTVGLAFSNCLGTSLTSVGTTFTPPTYTTSVFPVGDVTTYVPDVACGAGATLQVTTSGVLSASTCTLGINETPLNFGIKHYPTLIEKNLYIDFPEQIIGIADIVIYDVNGKKVFSTSKNINSDKRIELELESLTNGIYVCKLQIDDKSINWKFIKK